MGVFNGSISCLYNIQLVQGIQYTSTNTSNQGRGNDFFLGGGGKSVDMPSDCQNLGGGTDISIPLRLKVGRAIAPLAPPAPAPLPVIAGKVSANT